MKNALVKRFRAHWKTCRDVIWTDPLNRGKRIQFTLQYLYWHAYAKFRRDWILTLENGMRTIVRRYPDNDSGEVGIYTRNMDYHEMQFVRKFLPGGTYMIDAGCNVGNRTLALADRLEGAFLFDAGVTASRRTLEHMQLNKLDPQKFRVIHKAIGATPGKVYFTNLGGASTLNKIVTTAADTASVEEIELTTIDLELRNFDGVVSFLKVDVEGHDYEALLGASSLLHNPALRLVMFERIQDDDLKRMLALFPENDWKIVTLDDSGKPTDTEDYIGRNLNLFAVRREFLYLLG
jgi:FkbM family methyltransferase